MTYQWHSSPTLPSKFAHGRQEVDEVIPPAGSALARHSADANPSLEIQATKAESAAVIRISQAIAVVHKG